MLGEGERGRAKVGLLKVAIVGPPNAGKSTLFNRFMRSGGRNNKRLQAEKRGNRRGRGGVVGRAIVSDISATTRDRRECEGNIAGIKFRLFDTAGVDDDVMGAGSSSSKMRKYYGAGRMSRQTNEDDVREDIVLRGMAEQTLAAVTMADVVFLLYDGRALVNGGSPVEVVEMARWLRKHIDGE